MYGECSTLESIMDPKIGAKLLEERAENDLPPTVVLVVRWMERLLLFRTTKKIVR